ncbi:MAG: hypothetical protein KDJ37_11390 [Hyphomicrobiaceae bacterium]|nr:hypothetical protein [Hyphomicrobiaceae bacterium]
MSHSTRGAAFATLLSLSLSVGVPALAEDPVEAGMTYSLGGIVDVLATEHAVDRMKMGLWASLSIDPNGAVSGTGVIRFETANPCHWAPPNPAMGQALHCRIDDLVDGRFTVSGEVLETVHRHDEDNVLKNAIFELTDKLNTTRFGYAPLRMKLKLALTTPTGERLSLWGFSKPTVEKRNTGASLLGLLSAKLFDREFEISPIAWNNKSTSAATAKARYHHFNGTYQGGTPVAASGSIFFVDVRASDLPVRTDRKIFLVKDDLSPNAGSVPRPFTEAEDRAIKQYTETGSQQPTRFDDQDIIDLITTIDLITKPANNGPGAMHIGLMDDTHPKK